MTVTVRMLTPGDEIAMWFGDVGTIIGVVHPHPLYPTLSMVIWWLEPDKRWSFDALSPDQELPGVLQPANGDRKRQRLRRILQPGTTDGMPR